MAATKSSTSQGAVTGKKHPRFIRKLGYLELFHSALQVLNQYNGTGVSCNYNVPEYFADAANEDELRQALDLAIARTIREHPMMQVGIFREGSRKPAYIELDTVDLDQHVEWHVVRARQDYDTEAAAILKRLVEAKYPDVETRPPWRLALVRCEEAKTLEAMFMWNHSIGDGMSGKIFHETLLRHLNDPPSTEGEALLKGRVLDVSGSAKNFPPPQEKMVKYSMSLNFIVSTLWNEVLKPAKPSDVHASWAPIRAGPFKTELRRVTIENSTLQTLLIACRNHKTTLTGLIHGIILVSMASQLQQQQAAGFTGRTAMNMRPYTPASPPGYPNLRPDETMANIVSITDHEYDADLVAHVRDQIQKASSETDGRSTLAEVIWSTATTTRDEISKAVSLGVKNNLVGVMGFIPDWREHNKSESKKPRHWSWSVTNLGVLDGAPNVKETEENNRTWSVESASFSISAHESGPAIVVCPIAVKGGKLNVDLCWQDGAVDSAIGDGLTNFVKDWLTYLGTKEDASSQVTQ